MGVASGCSVEAAGGPGGIPWLALKASSPPKQTLRLLQDARERAERDTPWRIIVHNDDFTPMEFVTQVLHEVFKLGWARAVWVMLAAHATGSAQVGLAPKAEAQERIAIAHARARGKGWPLHFSAEPAE